MRKLGLLWSIVIMVCLSVPSSAFAETGAITQTKDAKAGQDFSKVFEQALEEYAAHPQKINMIPIDGDTEYCRQRYTLDDGTTLIMEFMDRKEDADLHSPMEQLSSIMPMAANGETVWKDYGNRYFTAKATVTTTAGSGWVSLENHYTLSADGIDERYGVANAEGSINAGKEVKMNVLGSYITDSAARTVGASDVNIYAEYLMKASTNTTVLVEKKIRLTTSVGYVAHNRTTKQIQVKHSWRLV